MQARAADALGGICRGVQVGGRREGVWCGGGCAVHGAARAPLGGKSGWDEVTAKVRGHVNEDIVTAVRLITRMIVASLKQFVTCRRSYGALQFYCNRNRLTVTTAPARAGLQQLAVTSDRRKARPVETPTNKQAHAACTPQDEARGPHLRRSRQVCDG
jgi:hypothetical protein